MKTPDIYKPLADRLRPKKLSEFVGQKHLLDKGKPVREMLESGRLHSMILWGPPGSGKTTLARLIAEYIKANFVQFSAVTSGVAEVRKVIAQAKDLRKAFGQQTILFIDEIHRFNKAQQDGFLPTVEDGTIVLIGATTENPGFEVNAPLISRCQVYVLYQLSDEDLEIILRRAGFLYPKTKIDPQALKHLSKTANGDARAALSAFEVAANLSSRIDIKVAEEAAQRKAIYFDKKGDFHYDTISAFIKSMRGSDPDASLYWLARMIKAGEDPIFIARRMVIFAAEDVGNAHPTALVVATSCLQAVHMVGMPEAQIILAQCAAYLATCPKSIASYEGLLKALDDVDEERLEPVPLHLRNPVNPVVKKLSAGKSHIRYRFQDPEAHKNQTYLPKNLEGRKYYQLPEKGENYQSN